MKKVGVRHIRYIVRRWHPETNDSIRVVQSLKCAHAYLTLLTETGLSDVYDRGITVTEMAAMDDPVDVHPKSAAAFIGRALRGPINTPVLVRSLGDFGKRFGGVWPKSSLGPAVQQFFEHGGRRLYVVRVANGATRARVEIPTGEAPLVLTAVDPGSAETIRVSVDYDRLPPDDSEHFNLI